jgi:hypothetical protein
MTGHHRQAKVGERQGDAQPKRKQLNPLGGTKGGHKQAIRKQEIQHTSTSAANFSRLYLYTLYFFYPHDCLNSALSQLCSCPPSLVALEDGVAIKSKHNNQKRIDTRLSASALAQQRQSSTSSRLPASRSSAPQSRISSLELKAQLDRIPPRAVVVDAEQQLGT